jgi:hypothetical protein
MQIRFCCSIEGNDSSKRSNEPAATQGIAHELEVDQQRPHTNLHAAPKETQPQPSKSTQPQQKKGTWPTKSMQQQRGVDQPPRDRPAAHC